MLPSTMKMADPEIMAIVMIIRLQVTINNYRFSSLHSDHFNFHIFMQCKKALTLLHK
jgi:hypothetical protein